MSGDAQSINLINSQGGLYSHADHQILPSTDDFWKRLCLAPLHSSAPSIDDANCGEFVDKNKLWPAIKFESVHELIEEIRSSAIIKNEEFCQEIKSEYEAIVGSRLDDTPPHASLGIVYYIGRGNVGKPFLSTVVKAGPSLDIDEVNLFSFHDHFMEMEEATGPHCGSAQFQFAYKLALERLEKDIISEKTCFNIEYTNLARTRMAARKEDALQTPGKSCENIEYSELGTKRKQSLS